MLLSVVIPVFNEEALVDKTFHTLKSVLKEVEHELIFINDGSTDQTEQILSNLLSGSSHDRCISFSRNFGHQAAFSAGLQAATGDAVVIIDGDLQDPPEVIHELLERWREGYEVVYAQRRNREGETFFKIFSAKAFYRVINMFTREKIPVDTGDFRLMDRIVVDHLNSLPERSRFLRGLVPWVGFRQVGVLYDRKERQAGESKYPIRKMVRLATDGITSFSSIPLKIALYLGILVTLIGLGFAGFAILQKILNPEQVQSGWTSLVIIIIFMGGVQLVTIGILGEYIGRIYDEVKQRPLYILKDQKRQRK